MKKYSAFFIPETSNTPTTLNSEEIPDGDKRKGK